MACFPPSAGAEYRAETLDTSATLSWDLTLIDFGRNKLAIEASKETVLATREALIDLEQRVLLTAVQSYVNVRLTGEIVDLRKNNVRLIGQELKAAQDRFDVGEITRTDVAIAESRLAASRANLAAAEGDYQVARESYKAATGAYPGNLAALPKAPKIPESLGEAQKLALRSHPLLRQAQHEVLVADLNVARAEAEMRPSLGARATVGVSDGGVETNQLTLSMTQTIYAGGRLSALATPCAWPRKKRPAPVCIRPRCKSNKMSATPGPTLMSRPPVSKRRTVRSALHKRPMTACAKKQSWARAPRLTF